MYHVSFSWHVFLHLRIALLSLSRLLFSVLKFTIYSISTSCGRFENPLISVINSLKGSSLSMSVLKCWCRSRYKTLRLLAWECLELSRQLKITFFSCSHQPHYFFISSIFSHKFYKTWKWGQVLTLRFLETAWINRDCSWPKRICS